MYPDSWDANCQGNNQGKPGKSGPGPTCRNEIRDMGLTSGDGRTYRWYGFQNRYVQENCPSYRQ